ncbi:GNAT family protein [Frigoribacterium sp. UYMn621]|uniref:GNAT family N-acetyltransferase n=1 Tax=Frigoribacterium sp. UYMn621 TaxID=3156343 RepID=UPI0033959E9E
MSEGIDAVAWPVRTERLQIRPAVEADGPATWLYRGQDSVSRWITSAQPESEHYLADFVEPGRLAKTLVIELDGRVIGDLMLAIGDAWAQAEVREQARAVQAELGWSLDPAFTGKGYATEAVAEVIRICFEELHLRRVIADCFADNEPSWRLMERVGMRRESHDVRGSLHRSGEWLDGLAYALLADEWRSAR